MVPLVFHIIDVFALEPYTGNPLAVVRNAAPLTDAQMQAIAREMNYSETTFILGDSEREGGYDVRIFTPKAELPFAGHPTLGTAYILRQEVMIDPPETIYLHLKVGKIPVTREIREGLGDLLWMEQKAPIFRQKLAPKELAGVLKIGEEEIDPRFPIQEISTGVPFIIVPLKSLDTLRKIRVDQEQYFNLIAKTEAKAILAFCPETYHPEHHLCGRVFADYLGIPEDPATGSANGCLAGYLVEYQYFGESRVDVQVEQGYEIDRPSLLYLKADRDGEEIKVKVGGGVVAIAKGELFV